MKLEQKVTKFIQQQQLIQSGQKVLVGVSGGADSICLLTILNNLKYQLGIELHVAHFDHNLRKDSKKDQTFVSALCETLNIPYTTKMWKNPENRRKGSLEEIAREKRFDFLIKTAKKINADAIALGQHKNDQAETVLMRILRGCGLQGLRGILPKRTISETLFIRPLHNTEKKEIIDYLNARNIKYREDPTNKTDDFFRNKIRRKLIPLINQEYSQNINNTLYNLAENVMVDYDFLKKYSENLYKTIAITSKKNEHIKINVKALSAEHTSIQRRILRHSMQELTGHEKKIDITHIKEIEDLILSRPNDAIVHLPHKIVVKKAKSALFFYKKGQIL